MEREHETVWGATQNAMELSQKSSEEPIVTTLKTQVSKIDPFTKNGARSTVFHPPN